ncbi:FG-GAP repeat protein [Streptomyces sp. MUM 178J]|uniref:FG-GAP repeat protein n=1 Tax=Streptomyces sp. MUM 178J TaxID=2791991 RepID=UPI001F041FB7|nr:FG-GAP repeat protein [Streptomyces sp. MUM 178J]WRQ82359.1 FG-GAP repeat protein [Streptomyces sp. MUM 178J]
MALCGLSLGALSGSTAAAASGCTAGTDSDFNGDGIRDMAIADPEATVAGQAEAGLVRVVYGGGKGTAEVHQGSKGVTGGPEADDKFGHTLAVYDGNKDGCSDLVVGVPYEGVGAEAEAGAVHVIYGAPAGLGEGPAGISLIQGTGTGGIAGSAPEGGDWFGFSLAAGATAGGEPYLVIGVPGEDLGTTRDSGVIHYVRRESNVTIHQDVAGMAGVPEENDRFGYSLAGSPRHVAIGTPGEAIGAEQFSGGVQVVAHQLNSDGVPAPVIGFDQDSPGINGVAEADDRFGGSLAMVPYRPSGASAATDSILAIGSPGEDLTSGKDAGRVILAHIRASGAMSQTADISQDVSGVLGAGENGDFFGQTLTAVNAKPKSVGSASTMLLAVGIPGEDLADNVDAGAVQVFPMTGPIGDGRWIQQGELGLPGVAGPGQYVGTGLLATADRLYLGQPYGPTAQRGVYGLPWANILSDGTGAVTATRPGEGGLPAEQTSFGAVIR